MIAQKVRDLLLTLRRHDRATAEHSARVRRYALWLADEFGLPGARRRQLSLAALLHDVGKICLPASLLNKPGRLSADEYQRVQLHAVTGEWILRSFLPQGEALDAVRWHHERPDGSGYPDGLVGRAIPLAARLLAVSDAFDAMTSSRPYCPTLTWPQALDALWRGAGGQFDADVVECFAGAVQKTADGRRPQPEQR